jgi:hypothetical protein
VETARVRAPDPDKLAKFCGCLGDLADAGGIPSTREQVDAFMSEIAAQGYPVVHHSPGYREAYAPAYRVVALGCLPGIAA